MRPPATGPRSSFAHGVVLVHSICCSHRDNPGLGGRARGVVHVTAKVVQAVQLQLQVDVTVFKICASVSLSLCQCALLDHAIPRA